MPPSRAIDAHVLRLIRASLALWRIGAAVETAAGDGWRVMTDEGADLRTGRAPPGIPFRWMITTAAGRERPASSVTGLLRVLRSTLAPDWQSGRARIVTLTPPPDISSPPSSLPPPRGEGPAVGGQSTRLRQRSHSATQPLRTESTSDVNASFAEVSRDPATIPVTILTGFLGSGKTTLLAGLLKSARFARTAVIINEFGEVGIDHDLVSASDESFVTLETGCICCKVRGDLEATLADLMSRRASGALPAFERIVIETSGLADPAPVMNAVMTEGGRGAGITLEGVVTTVDAVNGLSTVIREPQAARQVASADRLIVTKLDLAPDGISPDLAARLHDLNAHADIVHASHGRTSPTMLIGDGQPHRFPDRLSTTIPEGPTDHDAEVTCVAIRLSEPVPALALPLFLEALADHVGSDLLRFKALVRVAEHPERPAVLHGVQHLFHEPQWLETWPRDDRDTRMVLIGRGLSRLWIETLLEAIVAEVHEVGKS
jgi:G3E family GTPase